MWEYSFQNKKRFRGLTKRRLRQVEIVTDETVRIRCGLFWICFVVVLGVVGVSLCVVVCLFFGFFVFGFFFLVVVCFFVFVCLCVCVFFFLFLCLCP